MPPCLFLVFPSMSIVISGLEVSPSFSPHFTDEQTEANVGGTHLRALSGIEECRMGQKRDKSGCPVCMLPLGIAFLSALPSMHT